MCNFLSDLIQAQKLHPSSLFIWVMRSVSTSSPKGCGLELCQTVSRLLRICWDNSIGGHWLLKGDQFPKWYGKVGFLESLGNCHWQECRCMICIWVNAYSFSKCFTSATLIRKELNDLSFWIHNSVKKLETLTDILEFLRVERAESNDTEGKVIIAHLSQKSVVEVHKHLSSIRRWMLYTTEATYYYYYYYEFGAKTHLAQNLTWTHMNLVLEYLDIFLAEMLKDKLWDVFPDAIGSVI